MVNSPAGFWIRFGATILDSLLVTIPIYLTAFAFDMSDTTRDNVITVVEGLYLLLIPIFWYGYTVGKRICGIRIARVDGKKVGIGTMLLRYIVGFTLVYGLTLGIAAVVSAFMVGFREDKRAIHDFIAGTFVTYEAPIN